MSNIYFLSDVSIFCKVFHSITIIARVLRGNLLKSILLNVENLLLPLLLFSFFYFKHVLSLTDAKGI